jgi:hypothetical protein
MKRTDVEQQNTVPLEDAMQRESQTNFADANENRIAWREWLTAVAYLGAVLLSATATLGLVYWFYVRA